MQVIMLIFTLSGVVSILEPAVPAASRDSDNLGFLRRIKKERKTDSRSASFRLKVKSLRSSLCRYATGHIGPKSPICIQYITRAFFFILFYISVPYWRHVYSMTPRGKKK
jgi:hypothetical protein